MVVGESLRIDFFVESRATETKRDSRGREYLQPDPSHDPTVTPDSGSSRRDGRTQSMFTQTGEKSSYCRHM